MVDPITVISSIATGLSLVDKFTDITLKILKQQPKSHTVEANRVDNAIEISRDGQVDVKVDSQQLNLGAWDQQRYDALKRKIDINWRIYNNIDEQLPATSIDERARLKQRLQLIKQELCEDFRELVDLAEKVLGTTLGDHYSLYTVCGMGIPI